MFTFAQKPMATQPITSAEPAMPDRPRLTQSLDVNSILPAQRTIGKQASQRLSEADRENVNGDSTTGEPVRIGHSFGVIPIHSKAVTAIHPKLTISTPADESEREAESVADQVMRMPNALSPQTLDRHQALSGPPVVQRACNCGGQPKSDEEGTVHRSPDLQLSAVADSVVARAINPRDMADSRPVEEIPAATDSTNEDTAQPQSIARAAAEGAGPQATAAPGLSQRIDDASHSGGLPLPRETRQFMEPRFGYNFGAVRIHADPNAGDLARQVQARAFATGSHIFFAPNEFQPERPGGKHLLAHELAHVVQQGKGGGGGLDRHIQRSGNGSLNCPTYASYDTSLDLNSYNCAGLAHRTYDFKSLADTKTALAKGTAISSGQPCDHVGVLKHWLWEYDIRMEDSSGKVVASTWQDFHTVGGPTDGDPAPKDSDEYYTKNGRRKVYGPGTAPSFKPAAKDQALENTPAEKPMVGDDGKPLYKVRSNIAESCYCLPCPRKP